MGDSIPEVDSDEDGDDAEWQAMQVTEVEATVLPMKLLGMPKQRKVCPTPMQGQELA